MMKIAVAVMKMVWMLSYVYISDVAWTFYHNNILLSSLCMQQCTKDDTVIICIL